MYFFIRRTGTIVAMMAALALAGSASAQVRTLRGSGPIREKPPGMLATIQRRDPDFSTIRFLGMQRDYRTDMQAKLLVGHAVIRMGRSVSPMQPIDWPGEQQ